jgi:predicted DCC family thiol-disulfide oxidoreductase YuxK
MELGIDAKGKDRALFLYDGGCGVCKFSVALVAHYDKFDHIRYRPLQTTTNDQQMKELCLELGIPPFDLSTAVLLEGTNNRMYTRSEAILYLFPHMGFPFTVLGPILLLLFPKFIRDFGYNLFAKHRGSIWIFVKRMTGLGETSLYQYRNKVLLPPEFTKNNSIPPSWGLDATSPEASATSVETYPVDSSDDTKKES